MLIEMALPATVLGQAPQAAADAAWAELAGLADPRESRAAVGELDATAAAARLLSEAARQQRIADLARSFQAGYPTDTRVAEARKREVLARLRAVGLGAAEATESARSAARIYRADARNAVADRFEVALTDESLPVAGNAGTEAIADRLWAEFGPIPAAAAIYRTVLRTADPANAARLAARLASQRLPEELRAEVQRALDYDLRRGRPVELSLDTLDGQRLDFARTTTVTVVCAWSADASPAVFAPLAASRNTAPPGTTWVYVAFGGNAPALTSLANAVPIPGRYGHDPAGLAGALAATLGVRQTPAVAVLGPGGKLVGAGPLSRLPALLAEVVP